MADPIWTASYDVNQTPEANGFTRILYNSPVVTVVTTGQVANRRVDVTSDAGDCVFLLSSVPSLSLANGATVEATVAVTGVGDAGFELTFPDRAFGVQVYANQITVELLDGQGPHAIATANNGTDIIVRATVSSDSTLRIYRSGVLVGTFTMPVGTHPLPRVLWWGEGGGVQTFKTMKYFIGGAVAP